MLSHGWERCQLDQACWMISVDGVLHGMVVGHVDDLLLGASETGLRSIQAIGEELGFGSFELLCGAANASRNSVTARSPST